MANDTWEYRTEFFDIETWWGGVKARSDKIDPTLNSLGSEGWELVNVVDLNIGQGRTFALCAFFKRRVAG